MVTFSELHGYGGPDVEVRGCAARRLFETHPLSCRGKARGRAGRGRGNQHAAPPALADTLRWCRRALARRRVRAGSSLRARGSIRAGAGALTYATQQLCGFGATPRRPLTARVTHPAHISTFRPAGPGLGWPLYNQPLATFSEHPPCSWSPDHFSQHSWFLPSFPAAPAPNRQGPCCCTQTEVSVWEAAWQQGSSSSRSLSAVWLRLTPGISAQGAEPRPCPFKPQQARLERPGGHGGVPQDCRRLHGGEKPSLSR